MRNVVEHDDAARSLLGCIRAYVELDILASFDVHTEITIKQGRVVAKRLSKLMNVSQLIKLEKPDHY